MKYVEKIAMTKAILMSNITIFASFAAIVKSSFMPSASPEFEYYFALAGNVSLWLFAMSLMAYLLTTFSKAYIRPETRLSQ